MTLKMLLRREEKGLFLCLKILANFRKHPVNVRLNGFQNSIIPVRTRTQWDFYRIMAFSLVCVPRVHYMYNTLYDLHPDSHHTYIFPLRQLKKSPCPYRHPLIVPGPAER